MIYLELHNRLTNELEFFALEVCAYPVEHLIAKGYIRRFSCSESMWATFV